MAAAASSSVSHYSTNIGRLPSAGIYPQGNRTEAEHVGSPLRRFGRLFSICHRPVFMEYEAKTPMREEVIRGQTHGLSILSSAFAVLPIPASAAARDTSERSLAGAASQYFNISSGGILAFVSGFQNRILSRASYLLSEQG